MLYLSLLTGAAAYVCHAPAPRQLHSPRAATPLLSGSGVLADGGALSTFDKWLELNGLSSEFVKGERIPGFGLSMTCPNGAKTGDKLLSVPASYHITPTGVRASPIGQAVADVIDDEDTSAQLALGLLAELAKGESGPFWAYLSVLPDADDMAGLPLLWDDAERQKLFRGSHMDAQVEQARAGLLNQWRVIDEHTRASGKLELFPPEVFNAPGYLWAHAIVLTRGLPFGGEEHLIPFLDLANHKKGSKHTCSIGVKGDAGLAIVTDEEQLEGKQAVAVLTAGSDLEPGEQTFIDYGEAGWRSSWEMLYTYGFVPGDSLEDWLVSGGRPLYFEGLVDGDPLAVQKQGVLVALGTEEEAALGTWLDLKSDVKQCVAMAPLLRLKHFSVDGVYNDPKMSELASQLSEWKADPRAVMDAMTRPLDAGTEAKVAAQVIATCEEALAPLPPVDELAAASRQPAADEEQGGPAEERARLAARVLLGERSALEACIAVWSGAVTAAPAAAA